MSRISSGIPIYAFTSHEKTASKVTLFRGVFPFHFSHEAQDHVEVNREIIEELRKRNRARTGQKFIITKGDLTGVKGGTNALKVVTVGEGLIP